MKKRNDLKKHIKFFKNISEKQLLLINIIIGLVVFLIISLFNLSYSIIFAFIIIFIYLFLTNRKHLLIHIIVSLIIAIIWTIIAKDYYGYNKDFLIIFGINLYPLFAWTVGLFWIYILYAFFQSYLKEKTFIKKITLFSAIYIPLLIFGEYVAYHIFNIQDIQTALYSGLPLCNCLHAPLGMKLAYFLMGPLFFIICYLLNLEKRKNLLN